MPEQDGASGRWMTKATKRVGLLLLLVWPSAKTAAIEFTNGKDKTVRVGQERLFFSLFAKARDSPQPSSIMDQDRLKGG